tara:strand:- start:312 stop:644 length:333 start_codon:yes stop_codon:yes gene_type:complete
MLFWCLWLYSTVLSTLLSKAELAELISLISLIGATELDMLLLVPLLVPVLVPVLEASVPLWLDPKVERILALILGRVDTFSSLFLMAASVGLLAYTVYQLTLRRAKRGAF